MYRCLQQPEIENFIRKCLSLTAKRILESRKTWNTDSSSFSKFDRSVFLILEPIPYSYGVLYGLVFDLETIGIHYIDHG